MSKIKSNSDYEARFNSYKSNSLFGLLDSGQQQFLRQLAFKFSFTFQEFRKLVEICRDLDIWNENTFRNLWIQYSTPTTANLPQTKKRVINNIISHVQELKRKPNVYPLTPTKNKYKKHFTNITTISEEKTLFGQCPVASEKTVCCNLYTIDAVQNCSFGCTYCSIQTFYQDSVGFSEDLPSRLKEITLDPSRRYHIGTGQASDSLVWGNRHGMLTHLCQFASYNPNVLLEFKTKSNNIRYFQHNKIPSNVVCSWSLNTPTIIANEEHLAVDLQQRLDAAFDLAKSGIKVAFHFHPMVHYSNWVSDYTEIAQTIMQRFTSDDVAFISFGSLTLIKPVVKSIRHRGIPSKLLQSELVPDPHGKLTYPDELKIAFFKTMYDAFTPWKDKVFFYLCMEKSSIWEKSFGYVYADNYTFEQALLNNAFGKINMPSRSETSEF